VSDILPDVESAIETYGRAMTLRRRVGTTNAYTSVPIKGIFRSYTPGELVGGIAQGDARVVIANKEMAAAAWPAPPTKGDQLVIAGRIWALMGAYPRTLGEVVLVYEIWCRGG
jgi:hypothetical protein